MRLLYRKWINIFGSWATAHPSVELATTTTQCFLYRRSIYSFKIRAISASFKSPEFSLVTRTQLCSKSSVTTFVWSTSTPSMIDLGTGGAEANDFGASAGIGIIPWEIMLLVLSTFCLEFTEEEKLTLISNAHILGFVVCLPGMHN